MNRPAHHVVAAILVREHRVLLCHRRADRAWYPDVWDLPGGHVEAAESAGEAVVRECREELGIDVRDPGRPLTVTTGDATMSVFWLRSWDGSPTNAAPDEHRAIGWFSAAELAALPLSDPRFGPLLVESLGRDVTDAPRPPSRPAQASVNDRRSP
jgi:8-oxo-dGTP diphosphatase